MTSSTSGPVAPVLLQEVAPEGYAVLTLNRPQALNALSRELRQRLALALDALAAGPLPPVLILTGAGRAFSAGLDLKELGAGKATLSGGNGTGTGTGIGTGIGDGNEEAAAADSHSGDPVAALLRYPSPVIGAINGAAVTGGFELALACDVLLASDQARFADTHARIGVAPGWGLSQRLARAIGPYRARDISLTARWVDAAEALSLGLVSRVVPAAQLMDDARRMAMAMLGAAPGMLQTYKSVINDGYALCFGDAMALEVGRAAVHNRQVGAGDIESRREAVRAHNRAGQTKST
ncbi:MAG: enoyl-CoA hydratase [Aquabacterium sp.]